MLKSIDFYFIFTFVIVCFFCNYNLSFVKKFRFIFVFVINWLQNFFAIKKTFLISFNKLISIFLKTTTIIVFQLSNYLHVLNNSHFEIFIKFNKRFIQQIVVNCFRFIVVKIDNVERQIKNNIFLSFYLID